MGTTYTLAQRQYESGRVLSLIVGGVDPAPAKPIDGRETAEALANAYFTKGLLYEKGDNVITISKDRSGRDERGDYTDVPLEEAVLKEFKKTFSGLMKKKTNPIKNKSGLKKRDSDDEDDKNSSRQKEKRRGYEDIDPTSLASLESLRDEGYFPE